MDLVMKMKATASFVEALNEDVPGSARLSITDNDWVVDFEDGPTWPVYLYELDDCCDSDRQKVILVVRTDSTQDGMVVDADTLRMNPDSLFVCVDATAFGSLQSASLN